MGMKQVWQLALGAQLALALFFAGKAGSFELGPLVLRSPPPRENPSEPGPALRAALERLPRDASLLVLTPPDAAFHYVLRFRQASWLLAPRVVVWGAPGARVGINDDHHECALEERALAALIRRFDITHVLVVDVSPRSLPLRRKVAFLHAGPAPGGGADYLLALGPE